MARDPYVVLGISHRATLAEAEEAYHRLMWREHPDVHHAAGPERVAEAELSARELTGAIAAIRAERAVRADVHADVGASSGTEAGEPTRHEARPREASWATDGPAATAACPWCGQRFDRAVDLKDHVFGEHDLRLDRRERTSLFGGRFRRLGRSFAHLPLWGVIPINLALAAVVGVAVTSVTDQTVGTWAAAITTAPTLAALLDRLFDITR